MNIKLDKDVRIRLSEEDVTNWKSSQYLEQSFKIGSIKLQVNIRCEPEASKSHIYSQDQKLVIELSSDDSANLISSAQSTKGISIEDVNIQADRWNQDKRERYARRMKDQHD